jgi:hypothetical protein
LRNAHHHIFLRKSDVDNIWPTDYNEAVGTSSPAPASRSSKSLIVEEVERRVAAGERWDSIRKFSESLHQWMNTLKGVKPLAALTIENRLRDWKLWPLQLLKK